MLVYGGQGVVLDGEAGGQGTVLGVRRGVERRQVAAIGGPQGLLDLAGGGVDMIADLSSRREPAQILGQLGNRRLALQVQVLDAPGRPDGPRPVPEIVLQLAHDRAGGEGREGDAALGVEAVLGPYETEERDLLQVLEGLGPVGPAAVAPGERDGEAVVRFYLVGTLGGGIVTERGVDGVHSTDSSIGS